MALLSKLQSAGAAPGSPTFPLSSDAKLVSLIEALRKDGLVKVLAEPTLITMSGRPAYMLVGGEFPYPDKDLQGKEVAAFKEYGTRFDVVPLIVSSDRIHLDFRLRVSEPDIAHGVQIAPEDSGAEYPRDGDRLRSSLGADDRTGRPCRATDACSRAGHGRWRQAGRRRHSRRNWRRC